jgi:hypothetical protein
MIALDPADDRLALGRRQGHALHQQRVCVGVKQVGNRDANPERIAHEVKRLINGPRCGLRRVNLVGRVAQRQGLAVVIEDLLGLIAQFLLGEDLVWPADDRARRGVEVNPMPVVHVFERVLQVHAELLQAAEVIGHPLQDLRGSRIHRRCRRPGLCGESRR